MRPDRQVDGDPRAEPLGRVQLHVAAMQPGEGERDRQAEAGALVAPGPAAIHLAEGAHGGVDLLARHARSVVADLDAGAAGAERRRLELYPAAGLGELD